MSLEQKTSNGYSDEKRKRKVRSEKKKVERTHIDRDSINTTKDKDDIPIKRIPPSVKYTEYSKEQLELTGPLIPNPDSLFKRKSYSRRPVPKYLLHQPRLLIAPPFTIHEWDKQNQQHMASLEASSTDYQGLYEQFQKLRETERKKMESLGLVDPENVSKSLNDAIAFHGTCTLMCPVFERVRRQVENNVKSLEKDPKTNTISPERAVKAFSRPAAGQAPSLPSDVRPPHVLVKTLDYLVDNIVDKLPEAHSFIWDRTRSIRQDFTYQNFFGKEAIDCNERIVRIHLLSLHIMAGSDIEYSQQQELEQFNKALQTLIEIYDDVRNNGGISPNEPEFRAYHLLSHYRNQELDYDIQNLPSNVFNHKHIQLALRLRNLINQNNIVERGHLNSIGSLNMFVEFFRLVYSEETPFLMSCLLETHFNEIRFYSLKAMSKSYHSRGGPFPAKAIAQMLGYDSVEKLIKFVKYYDVDVIRNNTEEYIDLTNKDKMSNYKLESCQAKVKLSQPYSPQLDSKIKGKNLKVFINQSFPNNDLGIKVNQKKLRSAPDEILIVPSSRPEPTKNGSVRNGFASTPAPVSFGATPSESTFSFQKPEVKPLFSFSAPKATNLPATTVPPTTKSTTFEMPTGLFSKPNTSNNPEKNGFKLPEVKLNTSSFGVKDSFTKPKIPEFNVSEKASEPTSNNVIEQPKLKPVAKRLTSAPQYGKAAEEVVSDLIKEVVENEIRKLLPRLIQRNSAKRERQEIISTLSHELYAAFLNEIIHLTTMENTADYKYNRKLKSKYVQKVMKIAKSAKEKHELKQLKIDEIQATSFNKRGLKRFSRDVEITKKRQNTSNQSFDISKQEEIEQLWAPLKFKDFIQRCSNNLKLGGENEQLKINFLLIVEDWKNNFSKWLNNKLQLKVNKQKMNYERIVISDKLEINFQSLPKKDQLNKDFFTKTGFILFECGLLKNEKETIRQKLARDKLVLNKILSLTKKFSFYKVQILLTFWDVSESGIEREEVEELLEIGGNEAVKLCDDFNQLSDAFTKIGDDFNGELSEKGKSKRQVKQVPVKKVTKSTIHEKEAELLHQAKRMKKYEYLNKYKKNENTKNDYNENSASYNSSFVSNLTKRRNNGNSTFMNSTNGSMNFSVLNGYGNGIEDSFAKKHEDLPQKLEELRNLTKNITAKYKR